MDKDRLLRLAFPDDKKFKLIGEIVLPVVKSEELLKERIIKQTSAELGVELDVEKHLVLFEGGETLGAAKYLVYEKVG